MKNKILSASVIVLMAMMLVNCSESGSSVSFSGSSPLRTAVLTNLSNSVIAANYEELNAKTTEIENLANGITAPMTDAQQADLKLAWQAARLLWEQSETVDYGATNIKNTVHPSIDSWPVDAVAISLILENGTPITPLTLANNNATRGFHAIEYLVWGTDGNKAAADFTEREIEYLKAAASDLQDNTQKMYDSWRTDGENYAANFIYAGKVGSNFATQKSALVEMAKGLATLSYQVATEKIGHPLSGNAGAPKPEAEESRLSNNTKQDLANNAIGIKNIYMGDFNGADGLGLSDVVILTNPTLDSELKTKLTEAIDAIDAIPEPFSTAIVSERPAVQNAQDKMTELKDLIETKLLPFLQNLQ